MKNNKPTRPMRTTRVINPTATYDSLIASHDDAYDIMIINKTWDMYRVSTPKMNTTFKPHVVLYFDTIGYMFTNRKTIPFMIEYDRAMSTATGDERYVFDDVLDTYVYAIVTNVMNNTNNVLPTFNELCNA